ncbi:TetR family transcriptional regulator [Vulcanimicrobium alpinum]|uniref:TetR family transcriptional regulator n=1 Tax=Vulcanimicrobium alpinum TaxID=3016050 RepID=A0AAN1XY41_UNVUL|nr:TetR/AcrR family transcriptional regulator [Vulcanimicrobium alpinum]BDE07532.1 TetR family transcriptional regulator [Vulcanimicrobium alpinum]
MANRGRPKLYDRQAALHAAMLLFWQRGYLGASMDELTKAMLMNRASVYASFGDKRQLFLSCVDHYLETNGAAPFAALQKPRIADAIRGFFRAVVFNTTSATTPGCLVASVLATAAGEEPELREKLQACLAITDRLLCARLSRAMAEGEVPLHVRPSRVARLVNSLRHGLTVRARAGESRRILLATADEAADLVALTLRASHA